MNAKEPFDGADPIPIAAVPGANRKAAASMSDPEVPSAAPPRNACLAALPPRDPLPSSELNSLMSFVIGSPFVRETKHVDIRRS
jgi:hypothetical protein